VRYGEKNKKNIARRVGPPFAGESPPAFSSLGLARYRGWLSAGPSYHRGDLERLRAFQPVLKPMAVYVHFAFTRDFGN